MFGPRRDPRSPEPLPASPGLVGRAPGRGWARRLGVIAAVLTGASAFAIATEGGRTARTARPLGEQIDRLADLAGLGLRQVNVTGHRMTPDTAIFDALELSGTASLLRFDSAAARRRIERLPWVRTATVERIFPDEVAVAVTERTPYAVWRKPGGDILIDEEGRELGPTRPGAAAAAGLPVVTGEGAAAAAHQLLRSLSAYPQLLSRLALAERVGDRRWTLTLEPGPTVHLPADDEAGAMLRLMAPRQGGRLIDREVALIDLRIPDRIMLRRERPQAQSAATLRY